MRDSHATSKFYVIVQSHFTQLCNQMVEMRYNSHYVIFWVNLLKVLTQFDMYPIWYMVIWYIHMVYTTLYRYAIFLFPFLITYKYLDWFKRNWLRGICHIKIFVYYIQNKKNHVSQHHKIDLHLYCTCIQDGK